MTQESELLLQCRRFRVERVYQVLGDGQPHTREVIRHPGAVVILPWMDEDKVCLIRSYRVAVNATLLELPAGTRETGEPPEATAHRELLEETGFRAGRLELLGQFYASPGIMDEQMRVYVAQDLRFEKPNREPGEQIENLIVPFDQALKWAIDGTIQDAKTICGLLLWQATRWPQNAH